MADGQLENTSDLNRSTTRNDCDFDKINLYMASKRVIYDGERIKWCDDYESLQEFVNIVFCQQGKWRPSGGNARRFEASTSDLVVIWYPGKLNTLTLKGTHGILARKHLINQSISPQGACEDYVKPHEMCCCRVDDNADNVMFQIEIIKSRLDAMQSLQDSLQEESLSSTVLRLSNEMELLQIDFEEEKVKNVKLESEIKHLRDEICIIKSLYNGMTCSTENTKINHEHDKSIVENTSNSMSESTSESRNGNETEAGVRLVDQIDKQIHDYRAKQHNKYQAEIEGKTQSEQIINMEIEKDEAEVRIVEDIDDQIHNYRSKQQNKYHLLTEGRPQPEQLSASALFQRTTEMKNGGYDPPQKAAISCPFLKRRGRCLKGNQCDFKHPKEVQTRKHNIPFLPKKKDFTRRTSIKYKLGIF